MREGRKCVLYVAASLDGFIAEENGSVSWLDEFNGKGEDYGYAKFLDTVDTLIMGRTTYDQVLTFGDWPYKGKQCYVLTHRSGPGNDDAEFTDQSAEELMAKLRGEGGKDIWLVGGAKVIDSFMKVGEIDVFIISVMPIILGSGIRLFGEVHPRVRTELIRNEKIGNVVQLEYRTVRECY